MTRKKSALVWKYLRHAPVFERLRPHASRATVLVARVTRLYTKNSEVGGLSGFNPSRRTCNSTLREELEGGGHFVAETGARFIMARAEYVFF